MVADTDLLSESLLCTPCSGGNLLALKFYNSDKPELVETIFYNSSTETTRKCIRGVNTVNRCTGSFPWSSAVKSFCLLVLKTKLNEASFRASYLEGLRGSPASSLDYAISKQPQWLLDMFGVKSSGRAIIKSLVCRENSERKRPGPTRISFRKSKILPSSICIYLDGVKMDSRPDLLELESRLKAAWFNSKKLKERADLKLVKSEVNTQVRLPI